MSAQLPCQRLCRDWPAYKAKATLAGQPTVVTPGLPRYQCCPWQVPFLPLALPQCGHRAKGSPTRGRSTDTGKGAAPRRIENPWSQFLVLTVHSMDLGNENNGYRVEQNKFSYFKMKKFLQPQVAWKKMDSLMFLLSSPKSKVNPVPLHLGQFS